MNGSSKRWKLGALLTVLTVFSLVGLSINDAKGDPPSRKQMREARIFERVVDDMLIDSPNFLVPGRDNARAHYVPGYGMIVTFETSLVSRDWGGFSVFRWGDHDDDHWRSRRWDDRYDDEDYDDDDDDGKRKSRRSRRSDRAERLYERGKDEIRDLMMDYGDAFDTLRPGDVVEVVAYLGDSDYFYDRDIERLVVRAKVEDLRAVGNNSISEEAFGSRIVVEEY